MVAAAVVPVVAVESVVVVVAPILLAAGAVLVPILHPADIVAQLLEVLAALRIAVEAPVVGISESSSFQDQI